MTKPELSAHLSDLAMSPQLTEEPTCQAMLLTFAAFLVDTQDAFDIFACMLHQIAECRMRAPAD